MLKRSLAIAGAILVVLLAGILILAAAQPDEFSVSRSTLVKAPPETVYALIADLRGWTAWSPYENKDPDMQRSYGGATSGKGAIYEWSGDQNVGAGRLEIVDVAPPSRVTIQLDFTRPFEAHNIVDFTQAPKGEATEVTWAMRGPMQFVSKVMCLFVDMDEMVGADFEAGLAKLKAMAEKQAGA